MNHTRKEQEKVNQKGFSFVELIVVIVVLGLLIGVVGPRVWSWLSRGQDVAVKSQISQLEAAIMTYATDMGHFPASEDGLRALVENTEGSEFWAGPYLSKTQVPLDPWNNEYVYVYPGNHGGEFDLFSKGKDGVEGTDDDITNW
jgi:general secretion pathway protein G